MTLDHKIVWILDGYRVEYEAGAHEAIEDALAAAAKFNAPLPTWLMAAVTAIVKSAETPRQKKARQARQTDKLRAAEVLTYRHQGASFEEAYERAAGPGVGADAIKKSTDRFLKRYRVKIIGPAGEQKPARRSRRID